MPDEATVYNLVDLAHRPDSRETRFTPTELMGAKRLFVTCGFCGRTLRVVEPVGLTWSRLPSDVCDCRPSRTHSQINLRLE